MNYTATGRIIKVGSVIPCTGKVKEKLTFIVRDADEDREIAFILFDKNIDLFMTPLEIGDKVKVTFSIKSREYNGSYTTNCFALNIEKIEEKKERTGREKYSSRGQHEDSFWERFGGGHQQQQQQWQSQQQPPPWEEPKAYTDYFSGCKNAQEAKKKYRDLCKLHHPDKGGDPEKMKDVNKQFERWK